MLNDYKKVFRHSFFWTFLAKTFSFSSQFIIASFLAPQAYAYIISAQLALKLSSYFNLGILTSCLREIPIAKSKGKSLDSINKMYATSFFNYKFLSLIAIIFILIFSFCYQNLPIHFVVTVVAVKTLDSINSIKQAYLKGEGNFLTLSSINGLSALLVPILSVVFVKLFGSFGFILSMLTSSLIICIYYSSRICIPFSFGFNYQITKKLFPSQFATFVTRNLDSLFLSLPLIYLTGTHNLVLLGSLGFILSILNSKKLPYIVIFASINKRLLASLPQNSSLVRNYFTESLFPFEIFTTFVSSIYTVAFLTACSILNPEYIKLLPEYYLIILLVPLFVNRTWYTSFVETRLSQRLLCFLQCLCIVSLFLLIFISSHVFLAFFAASTFYFLSLRLYVLSKNYSFISSLGFTLLPLLQAFPIMILYLFFNIHGPYSTSNYLLMFSTICLVSYLLGSLSYKHATSTNLKSFISSITR